MKSPYSLWKRKLSSGKHIYYVRFRLPNGEYSTAKSTGQTTKAAAETWALAYLSKGQIVTKERVTFSRFAEDFFDWDGAYVTYQRDRGRQIGRTHCRKSNAYLRNHLIPYFGCESLARITQNSIETWQSSMLRERGLSARTVNHMLICLRTVLRWAHKQGYIQSNPCYGIQKLREDPAVRGVLSGAEVKALFDRSSHWDDTRVYLMGKLSVSTGMRLGELIALKWGAVRSPYIDVSLSWEASVGLKKPKSRASIRTVIMPDSLVEELTEFRNTSPWRTDEHFVFSVNERMPLRNGKKILDVFYSSLRRIGIGDAERRERNIVFHSLRHFYNTFLQIHGVSPAILRKLTGHSSAAMTEAYTHVESDALTAVQQVAESLF